MCVQLRIDLVPLTAQINGMTEIVFLVEDDIDGGYTTRALGESIFAQADDLKTLRERVLDAVHCHFLDEQYRPKIIRLHIVRNEVIAS